MNETLQTRIDRIKIEIEAISEWPDGMHTILSKSLLVAIEALEWTWKIEETGVEDESYLGRKAKAALESIASTWEGKGK